MHLTPGETNLDALLRTMEPVLHPEVYVFCTVPLGSSLSVAPVATFREVEGLTLIVSAAEAAQVGLVAVYPCRWITLNVHSSLEAVGFLARITGLLATHGVSVNPVSGYYHDHLFVPVERAEEVMHLLGELRG
jgi:hypothetical protein